MAVATATALAIAGIASSAGSAGISFYNASESKKLQAQAQRDAAEAMKNARKGLSANFYESIGIPKETYELQSEAALSAGAQALQAGAESERGVAATAGRVQAEQNVAQAGIRTDMGNQLLDLEKLTAQEDSRLRDVGVSLDLATAQGAQMAARDAGEAAASQTAQGFSSATSAIQQGLEFVPLYEKSEGLKSLNSAEKNYQAAIQSGNLDKKYIDPTTGKPFDFTKSLSMQSGYEGITGLAVDKRQDYLISNSKGLKEIDFTTPKVNVLSTKPMNTVPVVPNIYNPFDPNNLGTDYNSRY